jgi:hypothetical protein
MNYTDFIKTKEMHIKNAGFDPIYTHDMLFDFQHDVVNWAIKKGRAAIFADCGLGKTPIQLVFADQICRKTNGKVLIVTPLAVSDQTKREGDKFGIDVMKSKEGDLGKHITVTNYERLHYFSPDVFSGIVLDESSILKNYAGKMRESITAFMQNIPYRLLCTATPAPNDYMEFGTSAEALSVMRRVEMLAQYFQHNSGETQQWTIRGHAEKPFWQWMSTWAKAIRRPSDLGYEDNGFRLPEFTINHEIIKGKSSSEGFFPTIAQTLNEQRDARRTTINERCERVAEIANATNEPFVAWCDLNNESALLTKLINGAVEVKGSDKDDHKENAMSEFAAGNIRCLVTKPSIAGFGMNWQHCSNMSYFPTHSHEQFYQATRRCWRFGQKKEVVCSMVYTQNEQMVVDNMMRKEKNSDAMYEKIIKSMACFQDKKQCLSYSPKEKMEIPSWLKSA